jgi:hypothetical protein
MLDSIKRLSLDVQRTSSRETVYIKRGGTGHKIQIALVDGGLPYKISEECYAVFTATKPDGNIVYNRCTIENNIITYEMTPQTVAVLGLVKCEIKLYGAEDKLITSPSFNLIIEDTAYNEGDEVEPEKEVDALTHLVSEATTVITEGNSLYNELVEARDSGEFNGPQGPEGEQGAQGPDGYSVYYRAIPSATDGTVWMSADSIQTFGRAFKVGDLILSLNGTIHRVEVVTEDSVACSYRTTLTGADGKSAYEYAQDGGYEGTEEEFAKKLADDSHKNYTGSGAPTTATAGAVGSLYMDTDTGDMYKCTAVEAGVYTWVAFGKNGGYSKTETVKKDVAEITTGYFLNPSDTDSRGYSVNENSNYAYAVAKVNPNDKYRITCSCVSSFRWVAIFRDENGVMLSYISPPSGDFESDNTFTLYTGLEIEVPNNVYDVVINSYINTTGNHLYATPVIEEESETLVYVGGNNSILFTEQELTEEQQAQGRANIGAASQDDVDSLKEIVQSFGEEDEIAWNIVGEVTEGAFINGASNSPYWNTVDSGNYKYAVARVKDGCKYRITCSSPASPKFVAMFRDGEGVRIGVIPHTLTDQINYYKELEIEVPDGAYDIVVNSYVGSSSSYVSTDPIIEEGKIVNLQTVIDELAADVEQLEYENRQLQRRVLKTEKGNDFAWGTFDKAYFVFVHDDTNSFLPTAYNAFHAENTPLSAATVESQLSKEYDGQTAKDWLDLMVADGGEVLMHYNADLFNDSDDDLWRTHVVLPKQTLEKAGFTVRGLILANASDANSDKGEKFCRMYYDYADKVGTSLQYNLGRTLMLGFADLASFKAHIDTCAVTPGIYAFGFHGLREDEAWITQASLQEIIQYINAKDNTEITTYGVVFDSIGTNILEKRISTLENA